MMSEVSKSEECALPKLPPCVKCKEADFRDLSLRKGSSRTRQFVCANCHTMLEFRSYGRLGVLVWRTDPSDSRLESLLHRYFQEVLHISESFVLKIPSVPKGLHAHVLEGKKWRELH